MSKHEVLLKENTRKRHVGRPPGKGVRGATATSLSFVTISTYFGDEILEASTHAGKTVTDYIRRAYYQKLQKTSRRIRSGGARRTGKSRARECIMNVAVRSVPEDVKYAASTRKLGGVRFPKYFIAGATRLAAFDGYTHAAYVRDSLLCAVRQTFSDIERGAPAKPIAKGASDRRDTYIVDLLPVLPEVPAIDTKVK